MTAPERDAPIVEIATGKLRGEQRANVQAYYAVPYAAPPVGALRFAAPQPATAWPGVRDASRRGPSAPQGPSSLDAVMGVSPFEQSEDCLHVAVWTPPVMVWLHGGAYQSGGGNQVFYDGGNLAAHGDAVVVSVNYRLGALGYLYVPGAEAPANRGLLDQIAALRWVRDNIAAFGGDPSRVTVAGESSGANNIAYLLASPAAHGLFHRAIMQSGASVLSDRGNADEALARGKALAAALGETGRPPSLDTLRAIDGKRVLETATSVYAGHYFDPVVDGVTVTEPLSRSVATGHLAPVPLLIGTNADEWRMYLSYPLDEGGWLETHASGREEWVRHALGAERDPARRLDRLETAYNFTCNSLHLAGAVAGTGQPAWVYHFTRVRDGIGGERLRAYHGAEIPYVFGTHDAWLPTTPRDRALSTTMMGYWSRFARNGDPNGDGAVRWPGWSVENANAISLGNTVRAMRHPELSLCAALLPDSPR